MPFDPPAPPNTPLLTLVSILALSLLCVWFGARCISRVSARTARMAECVRGHAADAMAHDGAVRLCAYSTVQP